MDSKPLIQKYGDIATLHNPIHRLDDAISKYGEIKTYFSKYKNPVGIELEIENVSSTFRETFHLTSIYWKHVSDGSLKFRGAEYVSLPLSGQNIDYAIHDFAYHSRNEDFLYSVRTSTHVHMNVSFMNWDELVSLILLSAYVEPLLYTLCAPERRGNPYCYPVASIAPSEYFSFHPDLKYCGINPAPIKTQLTVEYRQLHGTNDWKLLRRWVQLLSKVYYYAKTRPYKEVKRELISAIRTNHHESLIKSIFGASIILFPYLSELNENALWILTAMSLAENS